MSDLLAEIFAPNYQRAQAVVENVGSYVALSPSAAWTDVPQKMQEKFCVSCGEGYDPSTTLHLVTLWFTDQRCETCIKGPVLVEVVFEPVDLGNLFGDTSDSQDTGYTGSPTADTSPQLIDMSDFTIEF